MSQTTVSSQNVIQTDRFELSQAEYDAIEHEMHHYEDPRAASIEALKIVQKQRGWVPDGAIYAIADILGIPASDVEGVATFYSQIFRVPVGRHIIRVCRGTACHVRGSLGILERVQSELGLTHEQVTTPDLRFTLEPVACIGACGLAPVIMIDDETHGRLTKDKVPDILARYE